MSRRHVYVVAVLASVCMGGVAFALHKHTPPAIRITGFPSQVLGGLTYAGTSNTLLFHSDADLAYIGNKGVTQVFLFEQAQRVKRGRNGITQLTFGDAPSMAPAGAKRGKVVAFQSQADILGNGSTGWQIFVYGKKGRRKPATYIQVTRDVGESFAPGLDRLGRILYFESTGDLLGDGLAPGRHLYRADLGLVGTAVCPSYPCASNPGLTLVARDPARNGLVVNVGEAVVFESDYDVAGTGRPTGMPQLYRKNMVNDTVEQLTNRPGGARNATMTPDGSLIVFESPEGGRTQLFSLTRRADSSTELRQITSATDGDSTDPDLVVRGDRLVFRSTADLSNNGNRGIPHIFLLERYGPRLSQWTSGSIVPGKPATVFSFIVFTTTEDIVGDGSTGLHMYLLNEFPVLGAPPTLPPTPTPVPFLCDNPIVIPTGGGTVIARTSGASTQAGSCGLTDVAPETVFRWTPGVTGTATIHTCGVATEFDTVLYVRNKACDVSIVEVACNDDAVGCDTGGGLGSGRGSRVNVSVTAGEPHFIIVDGFNGAQGNFSLTVVPPGGIAATKTPTPTPTATPVVTETPTPSPTPTATVVLPLETPTATVPLPLETPTATVVLPLETPTATVPLPLETPTATVPLPLETPTATVPLPLETPTATVPLPLETPTATVPLPLETPTATVVLPLETPTVIDPVPTPTI